MNLLDFIFPKRCLDCGSIGKYFCDRCRLTIRMIKTNEAICPVCEKPAIDGRTHPGCLNRYTPDGLTSFFRYDGIVRKAIKALKYHLVSDLAVEFVSLIPKEFFPKPYALSPLPYVCIPIPLHPSRFRERGFNQAEVLGIAFFEPYGISMRTDILKRVKHTMPQVAMKDRKKRLTNMEHVFTVQPFVMTHTPCAIFLFDDVFTTGATMRSAANALKRAGAEFVWAVTMAR